MARRTIEQETTGNLATTRIIYDSDYKEYVVLQWDSESGERRGDGYHTDDKADAISTAKVIRGYNLDSPEEVEAMRAKEGQHSLREKIWERKATDRLEDYGKRTTLEEHENHIGHLERERDDEAPAVSHARWERVTPSETERAALDWTDSEIDEMRLYFLRLSKERAAAVKESKWLKGIGMARDMSGGLVHRDHSRRMDGEPVPQVVVEALGVNA